MILPAIIPKKQIYDIVAGGWKGSVPADAFFSRSRHDKEDLEQLKKDMGEHDFEAQYNQCPLPPGGYIFKNAWVKRYQKAPGPAKVEAVIQSWDTAYQGDETNSYTVCTTWAKCPDGYYLLDVWRDRPDFVDLVKQVKLQKEKWNAKLVIVERKASGISLIEYFNQTGNQPWLLSRGPEKGKVERAQEQTVKFEQGRVWLPLEAPWLATCEAEIFQFPHCKFDDQVDLIVQFLSSTDFPLFRNRLRSLV